MRTGAQKADFIKISLPTLLYFVMDHACQPEGQVIPSMLSWERPWLHTSRAASFDELKSLFGR